MSIVACYSVYNSADYLRASLESIEPFVDRFVIIDGKYGLYPGESPISTDGTLRTVMAFAKSVKKKSHLICWDKLGTQVEKRNEYLKYLEEDDWLFVIDGDNVVLGDPLAFREELFHSDNLVETTRFMNSKVNEPYFGVRLIRYQEGMRYEGFHWNLQWKGANLLNVLSYKDRKPMSSMYIIEMGRQRTKQTLETKKDYYRIRKSIEDVPVYDYMAKFVDQNS